MDVHSKEVRSYNMSCIKGKGTKPEEMVRKYLFSQGFRYRKNDKRLPGTPDIVLPKYKTVIFVNGCFWHGHECKYFVWPKNNAEFWKAKSLPSADEACGSWIQNTRNAVRISLENYGVKLRDGMVLTDVLKIKSRDTEKPNFKEFPVKVFFEKKIQSEYTKASVHGVKGETYDALLLLIESTRGTTLTPSFLASGDTSKELMRIAYVAMTRPRKLLVVAMPKSRVNLSKRFPRDKWDYVDLT